MNTPCQCPFDAGYGIHLFALQRLCGRGVTGSHSTIELSSYNFPDEAFWEYLKKFDINHDNKLASVERNVVKKINVNNKGITTLEGIEHFPELEKLYCSKNNLTSLDVSKNAVLMYLNCKNNQLTSLNVESTNIDIINNPYSGFDVQNNTYPIAVESNRTFDLSTLPGFDVSKA